MKKIIIFIIALIFTQTVVYSFDGGNNQPQALEQGFLNARGDAKQYVMPDTVVLDFEVTSQDKDPKKALLLNKQKAKAVIELLKSKIDKTKGDFVQTSNFSLSPRYSYRDKQRKLDYYMASHQVSAEVSDISKSGELIDLAVNSGANRVNNISFKLKNKDTICHELLKEASKKARFEAGLIAGAMGVKIGKVRRISYHCSSQNIKPYPLHRGMLDMAKESIATPIEPQNINLSVSVNVEYYLKD